jgi:putative endonuclease
MTLIGRDSLTNSHMHYYTYIAMNPGRTTLYIGMTNNLKARLFEHYFNRGYGRHFASRYHCYHLVYYEVFDHVLDAIAREKQLKGWSRAKKMQLIKTANPTLRELEKP